MYYNLLSIVFSSYIWAYVVITNCVYVLLSVRANFLDIKNIHQCILTPRKSNIYWHKNEIDTFVEASLLNYEYFANTRAVSVFAGSGWIYLFHPSSLFTSFNPWPRSHGNIGIKKNISHSGIMVKEFWKSDK